MHACFPLAIALLAALSGQAGAPVDGGTADQWLMHIRLLSTRQPGEHSVEARPLMQRAASEAAAMASPSICEFVHARPMQSIDAPDLLGQAQAAFIDSAPSRAP